jgi:hypothetical protein
MNNNPILINDPLGDTAVVRWGTGFLGLKRHEARFVGGQWIDSKSRKTVDPNGVSKERTKNAMNDYAGLSSDKDFTPAANINASKANVVLNYMKGGSSNTNADAYLAGKSNDIFVNVNPNQKLSNTYNEGGKIANLTSSIIAGHEFGHVNDILNGKPLSFLSNEVWNTGMGTRRITFSNSEINAMYWENMLRIKAGLPIRESYSPDYIGNTFFLNNKALVETCPDGSTMVKSLDGNTFIRN